MLDRITGKPVHEILFFIGCLGIAAGLPWSKVPLSLATAWLFLNFLLEGDFGDVFNRWKKNKALPFFLGYIAVELLSLLWTENFDYAAKDLVVKIPFFILPLLLTAHPFKSRKKIYWVVLVFIAACFITSFINIGTHQHWWGNKVYDDFRGLSLFVSHIRYALLIVLAAVFCVLWYVRKLPYRYAAVPLFFWFLFYTWFAQVISGYLAFGACVLVGLFFLFGRIRKPVVRISTFAVTLIVGITFATWIIMSIRPIPHKIALKDLPTKTVNGNDYYMLIEDEWENGYPVMGWLCEPELGREWNKRSSFDYKNGKLPTGEELPRTLWRYMTSKGLPKDSLGFSQMTDKDIRNVEEGINSISSLNGGLRSRLYTLRYQIEHNKNPNGHSLLERLEYWKAAVTLIQQHWLIGSGCGDVQDEFNAYYDQTGSKLIPENRHRAHQMYFTVLISSGIFGFLFFILWWVVQLSEAWKVKNLPWICFIAIALVSFLTEDTIETQLGGIFVAFFFGLFSANSKWFLRSPKR